jgi:hypothetical protein
MSFAPGIYDSWLAVLEHLTLRPDEGHEFIELGAIRDQ